MEIAEGLSRFIENSPGDVMPEAASELLEMLEADAVEPLGTPGREVLAEDVAERLEKHVERIRRKVETSVSGLDLLEESIAHLRARDADMLDPWSWEDGEGIKWFVLANQEDVVACYTSRPFIEAEI